MSRPASRKKQSRPPFAAMQALPFSACSDMVVRHSLHKHRFCSRTGASTPCLLGLHATKSDLGQIKTPSLMPMSTRTAPYQSFWDPNTVIEPCVYIACSSLCVFARVRKLPISARHLDRFISFPSQYSPARPRGPFLPLLCPRTPASRQPSSSLSTRALTASKRSLATSRIKTRRELWF